MQEHLNKRLLLYVVAAMGIGLLLGWPNAGWTKGHGATVSAIMMVVVFLIVFPMMINLKVEALLKAGRNLKGLLLAVGSNFVWAPLVGWGLARAFLLGEPLLALGFLLVMVVPCSSMSIAYTGLSEGNLELATVAVALSFVLAIVAVPLWMTLFAAQYHVVVPMGDILTTILTVLVAPLILGYLTRLLSVRLLGEQRFQKLQPLFPALSLLAMYGIVFLIFFAKATMIIEKWLVVLLLLVPNSLFIGITLVVGTWINRRLKLSYRDNMAVIFFKHRQEQRHRDSDRYHGLPGAACGDPRGNHADFSDPVPGVLPEDGRMAAEVLR